MCLSQSDEQRLKTVEKQSKKGTKAIQNITKDFLEFNKLIGLPKSNIKPFIDKLLEEKSIKLTGDKYSIP